MLSLSDAIDTWATLWPHVRENLPAIATLVAPFLGASTLSLAGCVPRLGPGRALQLYLLSKFRPKTMPLSLRNSELKGLGNFLEKKNWNQNYVVVTGEKGVGKSRLIATAMNNRAGVITIDTQPSDDKKTVVQQTLRQLSNVNWVDPQRSARRIISCYKMLTFGSTPIVVISTAERKIGELSPSLTGAVRSLVDKYGLRVVVDSSPNSVDDTLLQTKRALVFDIEPMSKKMIWSLPQLEKLFQVTKKSGLDEVTWAVLGGNPANYEQLWAKYESWSMKKRDDREVLGQLLCQEVLAARQIVLESRINNEQMEKIVQCFDKKAGMISETVMESQKLKRPSPDKVFRKIQTFDNEIVLVPSSKAIAIVLRHDLKKPTLEKLIEVTQDDLKKISEE